MHHYFNSITNAKGDALTGYYVKAVDTDTDSVVDIYGDSSATPIVAVSGLANAAQVDSDGNVSFWVDVGTYHLDIYATDGVTLIKRIVEVPMNIDADTGALAQEALEAAQEALETAETAATDAAADAAQVAADKADVEAARDSIEAAIGALDLNGAYIPVATIALLEEMDTDFPAYLFQSGRQGMFVFDSGDLSAEVTADPLQGAYIAPSSDPDGSSGAWVRQGNTLNPFMFGAATNYMTGNRSTGTPPFGESGTEGEIDGVLVDAREECQAMLDLASTLKEQRKWTRIDFSGGIWGITKRDDAGDYTDDGLVIDQSSEYPIQFVGGDFRGIDDGRNLIFVNAAQNSLFSGQWHVRSGADSGSSFGYAIREWECGIWLRNSAQCRWELVRVSGFSRWGVEYDPDQDTANNNNIGARFERLYVNNCGSACDRVGNVFEIDWTASDRTGSSNSFAQRTDLALESGHEILRVNDIVRSPAGSYHVIMEKEDEVISVYPWIISESDSGTLTSCHGGAMRVRGTDVAGGGADFLTTVTCGIALDVTSALHGTEFGNIIQEGGGLGTVIGTVNGSNVGHTISHMHSEGVTLDLLSIGTADCELLIGACSAWADGDYADPLALTEVLAPNDGASLGTTYGLPQVSIFIGGKWWNSGVTLGSGSNNTKSRSIPSILSNNPNSNHIRQIQASGSPTNITLKYYEKTDRFLRDHFVASLEVVGAGGGEPTETVTVTLDAADVTAGIQFANGTTSSTYVVTGGSHNAPLLVDFWLDTNGSTLRWVVVPR